MPTKYDTNPLDPEFPEKAKAAAAQAEPQYTQALPYNGATTQAFPYVAPTEEQTRRFVEPDVRAYSDVYTGQYVPAQYRPAMAVTPDQARKRKVEKIGLPENIMVALPYLPFSIGLVAGLIELLIVPKTESKVRFHAAQGLAAHIGILIVTTILSMIGALTHYSNIGGSIFTLVATIMMIIFMVKAWKGKPVMIEAIEDLTNWLEEKIRIK